MRRAASLFDWQGVFGETALFPDRRAFRMLEGEVAYAPVPMVGAARVVDGGSRSGTWVEMGKIDITQHSFK